MPGQRARALTLACGMLAVTACGPVGPIPSGTLSGDLVDAPVADWSFTDEVKNVQVETNPADPYSVNVWCIAHDGALYVAAGRGLESTWAQNLVDDQNMRVRIEGRLYERKAVRIEDAVEIEQVVQKLVVKYDYNLPDPEEREDAVLFRLDPR